MIDIEAKVFAAVKAGLPPGVTIRSTYQNASKAFPLVTVEETDNSIDERTESSDEIENFSILRYEVNVFTNKDGGKKDQARKIMSTVDSIMLNIGFVRVYCKPTPNFADSTIYRLIARYRAKVDNNEKFYRR